MPYERISKTLISDEKAFLSQAGLKKAFGSTFNERKQMSTKTSIKRIALVAVSALGFGLLSVAPSQAAESTVSEVTAVTIATPAVGRVNSALASAVGFTTASADDDDTATFKGIFVSKPAGSASTIIFDNTGLAVGGSDAETAVFTAATGFQPSQLVVTFTDATTDAPTDAAQVAGRVGFIPDVVGSYVVKVWHDADSDGAIDPTEAIAERTFTVGSAPTAVTVTKPSSTICASNGNGALLKVSLNTGTGLALGEAIRLTPSTATADITLVNGQAVTYTPGTTTYVDLTDSSFVAGVAWVNITDTAAGTLTVAIAGQGTAVNTIVGTTSVTVKTCVTGDTGTTVIQGSTAGAAFTSITDGINGTSGTATIPLAAKTITYYSAMTAGAADGEYFGANVTDTSGRVTGSASQSITGLIYNIAYLGSENATTATTIEGTFSVAIAPAAINDAFSVATLNGTDVASTVTVNGVVTSAGTLTVSPSTSLTLSTGSAVSYTVTLKDKWNRAIANASVAMAITGRNANQTVINPTSVTNASGQATFTYTDAPVAGTTSLTDSIVFTATGADNTQKAATAVTINWSTTPVVVGTVTVTTGTEDDTASSITYRDIAAGATGAQAGAATVTVTVKDASGNLLAGVPVTVTTASAGAAVLSTSATVYTGAAGTATASVYGWTAGTKTFTATAGGVSGSGTVNYKQQTATEVRSIEAAISGQIVTVTAKDRFGNTVEGVTIYGTRTGTGFFGNGASSSSAATDKNGVAEFVVNGTGTFKFAAGSATAADVEYGQTASTAGKVGTTAVTAYVAGTSSAAEKGVGDTFAAAGVNSASLAVAVENTAASAAEAAADAAAEAIDAANAATDAANLAAEAADAATVAAEEARDAADAATAAVEELATQVATLMAALKAQITTLANTVAKIAKKVKA